MRFQLRAQAVRHTARCLLGRHGRDADVENGKGRHGGRYACIFYALGRVVVMSNISTTDAWLTLINRARTARLQREIDALVYGPDSRAHVAQVINNVSASTIASVWSD